MSNTKFKVILLGDASVGKTSIAVRHCTGIFEFKMISTVGVSHLTSTVTVQDREVKLMLWDTAGQEQFSALVPMYARGAQVCIIVASVLDLTSIDHIELWEERLHESGESPPVIVAINKIDMLDGAPTNIDSIREKLGDRYPALFFVSARTGDSIYELFYEVALTVLRSEVGPVIAPKISLKDEEPAGCC
jgi:small GTP-binding protein